MVIDQVRSLNMNLDQCGTDYGSCHGLYSSQGISQLKF